MTSKLFEVQVAAKAAAAYRERYGYFLEQGLGKSLLVYDEFADLVDMGKASLMPIFCPPSLISNWQDQNAEHGFNFPVHVAPSRPKEMKAILEGGTAVVLYNYESIIANAGKTVERLLTDRRCYTAFDESVQIKNFKSARWKMINGWRSLPAYVRLLSGRPMVHSPMDLWSQLSMLRAPINESPYAFRNTYCEMGGFMRREEVGVKNLDRLNAVIDQVAFVATKKEWTDLPEKLYTDRSYEMTEAQAEAYGLMLSDMMLELKDGKIASVNMAVHQAMKLQQISSGFVIDDDDQAQMLMPFDKVPKVRLMDEILDGHIGKTLVFAHYNQSIDMLIEHFGGCPFIRGQMKPGDVAANKRRFNEDDTVTRMVLQQTSGKYGHTLLGSAAVPCHNTIYFENNYELDARLQSEDRNHRFGQKNPVLYTDLIGTPVERRIIKALQRKDNISRVVMGILEGAYR